MSREEVKKLIAAMVACYPNYKPNDIGMTVDVWSTLLGEYEYSEMSMALQSFVMTDTSGFAPSIGQLVAKHRELTHPQEMNSLQAWSLVSKALRKGGTQEEFDKLPPLVQKSVGSASNLHNWSLSDEKSVETVICSNFKRVYEGAIEQEQKYQVLPSNIKELIEQTTMKLIGVG